MNGLLRPLPVKYPTTQHFANPFNLEPAAYLLTDAGGPVKDRKTKFAGSVYRPKCHNGVDIGAPVGTKVLAAQNSIVILVGTYVETGEHYMFLQIRPCVFVFYTHLSTYIAKPGDHVTQGQPVARSGATGHVTGPHLHWEVRYSTNISNVHLSYAAYRWNPERLQIGHDMANVPWIKPV